MSDMVLTAPFVGELGHELMFWQGLLRWEKMNRFKDRKMVVSCLPGHQLLYEFSDELLLVPEELITEELYYTQSTWESERSNGINVWFENLSKDMSPEEVIRPEVEGNHKYRHGYWDLTNNKVGQSFLLLQASNKAVNKAVKILTWEVWRWGKYVVIYPRSKPGKFATRNWNGWKRLIGEFKRIFPDLAVVVVGVEPLTDAEAIEYADFSVVTSMEDSDLDLQVALLQNAAMSFTPISGCTFLSLLSGCPSFVIGPAKCEHHLKYRNVFSTKSVYFFDPRSEMSDRMPDYPALWDLLVKKLGDFTMSCMDGRFSI